MNEQPLAPASFPLGNYWYVVETAPHYEIKVEASLKEIGFDAYAPRSKHFRAHPLAPMRRIKVEKALFQGYCFVSFDIERDEWWRPIHAADGVRSVLSNNLIPSRVQAVAIERIRKAEQAGAFDFTTPKHFSIGESVEIISGPFTGLIGKIRSANLKKRLRLLIGSLLVEVDACKLSKV